MNGKKNNKRKHHKEVWGGCIDRHILDLGTSWKLRWYQLDMRLMSLRAGPDDMERTKILLLPGLKLNPLAVHPIASHYTNRAIPAPTTL
jgi:hypothetical protein